MEGQAVIHEPDWPDRTLESIARRDVSVLEQHLTVEQALEAIRERGAGERIVYFYVVDRDRTLMGVLPVRSLLTSALDRPLADLMITRLVTLKATATVLQACEAFLMHRYLSLPVVDGQGRLVGAVDVDLLADEALDLAERDQMSTLFETLGFRVSQVQGASPLKAFRFRFPWLLPTIASGTLCALLVSVFEQTLAESIVLAFFLTLALGLGESVSIQSMTLAIQELHALSPTLRWYLRTLRRELSTALPMGAGCGLLVGVIVHWWQGEGLAALAIGGSLVFSLAGACVFGLSVPALLHASRLDPRIAAGPVTLALADLFTLGCYFGTASLVL